MPNKQKCQTNSTDLTITCYSKEIAHPSPNPLGRQHIIPSQHLLKTHIHTLINLRAIIVIITIIHLFRSSAHLNCSRERTFQFTTPSLNLWTSPYIARLWKNWIQVSHPKEPQQALQSHTRTHTRKEKSSGLTLTLEGVGEVGHNVTCEWLMVVTWQKIKEKMKLR